MIALLKGIPHSIDGDRVIFLAGNVGYDIYCSKSLIMTFTDSHSEKVIFIHTHYSEHAAELFAFLNQAEKQLFKKLITVNGVGPKAGMALINTFGCNELVNVIYKANEKALVRAPGIGKKTAQRLIIELSEFAGLFRQELPAELKTGTDSASDPVVMTSAMEKTMEALKGLGYKPSELQTIESQLSEFEKDGHNLGEMVKHALALLRKETR